MDRLRKFRYSLATLIVLIGGGTLGYMLIKGRPKFEALYMRLLLP